MTDNYTKAVLTIIAGCLIVLVFQNAARPVGAFNGGCGDTPGNPCYVSADSLNGEMSGSRTGRSRIILPRENPLLSLIWSRFCAGQTHCRILDLAI